MKYDFKNRTWCFVLLFLLLGVVKTARLYAFEIMADTNNRVNMTAPEGAINGLFSVSETQQVWFSQGNLQYQASTGTWKFATNSYDYVGGKRLPGGSTYYGNVGGSNNNISMTYSGWIDLFGWGTSGWNNGNHYYQPYDWLFWPNNYGMANYNVGCGYGPSDGTSYDFDLVGPYAHADWGVHNPISNGGNQSGLWRTMTSDEWNYVLKERKSSTVNGIENARFAKANIRVGSKTFAGVILFPDEYVHPSGVAIPQAINMTSNLGWNNNTYTTTNWTVFQEAGCVFLPPASFRMIYQDQISVDNNGEIRYWTSTANNNTVWPGSNNIGSTARYWGCAVRLVQDYDNPLPVYRINVSSTPVNCGEVLGGGAYREGQTCNLRAIPAMGYIFSNWTENGNEVSTNATFTFTVNSNRDLVANFKAQSQTSCTINVSADPNNGGTVTGGGVFESGQSCTVSVTPAAGFTFDRWTENGVSVSIDQNYTFTVTSSRNLVAHLRNGNDVSEQNEKPIEVYPNPVSHILTIKVAEPIDLIEIYSLTGTLVFSETNCSETKEIQMNGFNNGTYLMRLITGNSVYTRLFVKE